MGAYGDRAVVMQPVWVVDRNGSDGFTDPLITADTAVMAALPALSARPSVFYLPVAHEDGSPIAGISPVYRGNNGSMYTKLLTEFGFNLEETLGSSYADALDDTTQLLLSPQRTRSRPSGPGKHFTTVSERELGYGWKLRHKDKYVQVPITVTSGNHTYTIQFSKRAGGQLSEWRVQMNAPALDRQIVNRTDYGRSFQTSFTLTEAVGDPAQFNNNPTQAGDSYGPPAGFCPPASFCVPDWEAQASPLLAESVQYLPNGSVVVDHICFPLFFLPDDHPPSGGRNSPVAWLESKIRNRWTFNWDGREGVHKVESYYFTPFDIPYLTALPAPGPQITGLATAVFLINAFDEMWIYDAGNDTQTLAVQGVTGPAYDGSSDSLTFTLSDTSWTGPGGPISPPAAHPMPSGTGAVIWRDTGNFVRAGWNGLGDDFAVGQYTTLVASGNSNFKNHDRLLYTGNFQTNLGQPEGHDGWTGLFMHAANTTFGGQSRGWLKLTNFLVTDIYANVVTKMRQLYLDGMFGRALQ